MSLLAINLDGGQTDAGLSQLPLGALFTSSGVLRPNALTASEQSPLARAINISGSAANDIAIIKTADGSTYAVKNTSTYPVTILANSSGVTKTDAIVLFVNLNGGDPDNAGSPGAAEIIAVRRAGVSTGLPTDGEIDAATSNNPWLLLHRVTVEHGAGEIEDEDLTDSRVRCKLHTQFFGDNHLPGSALANSAVTTRSLKPTFLTAKGSGAGNITTTSGTYANLVTIFSYTAGATNEKLHVQAYGTLNVSSNAGILRINATGTGVAVEDYSVAQIETTSYREFAIDSVITVDAGQTATIAIQGFTFSAATMTILNANTTTQTWHGRLLAFGND